MKKIIIILMILLLQLASLIADYRITRGPEVGEIYFVGPTVTESAVIYHSTDFGETASCMDSTFYFKHITCRFALLHVQLNSALAI